MAYNPETASELTVFTFHHGHFTQIVRGGTGMQIASQICPQAELFYHLTSESSGKEMWAHEPAETPSALQLGPHLRGLGTR